MSISTEALQKLVHEIENQALLAEQQIGISKSQVASKQREIRLLNLTMKEVSGLSKETPLYKGLGKMFVSIPEPKLMDEMSFQMKELEGDIDKLGKRLQYLETTHKNSRDHIEQMLRRGGGPAS
ncbi:putative prefoldin subunit 1 [Ceratocystis lukuohia]|uniref:Prefoldin subunit 1 n=2 Tax=Ceratocystis TaxID=5157 RepID=A0ABR4MQE8_9PEZI|nr:putative prefoldin subunit 1 [Ceratocystis fimbriata CBS 114723]